MADLPLFPAVCGRGSWQAICRFSNLTFPADGYQLWSSALQAGEAIPGPTGSSCPPPGIPVGKAHNLVQPGHRVALYVHTGSWQGWHSCEVLDVDGLGCYLRHEEDDYRETIPWGFLSGRYRMELLPDNGPILGEQSKQEDSTCLGALHVRFQNLRS